MVKPQKNLVVSGKRKTSVARATIKAGSGKITINKRPMELFPKLQQLELQEPLMIAKDVLGDKPFDFDISVNVMGGGLSSRVEASRLAIARAIVKFKKSEKIRQAMIRYDRHLIIADIRRKEAYKPGDSKARAKRQSSKR